jgi:hypothetical protein
MALHVDLLEGVSDFTWGAFADGFYRAPDGFDLNDRWTLAEAGSALKGEHYPLKTFHSFDNTCRGAFGDVDDDVPGLCAPDELSSQEATPAPQSGQGVAPPVIVVTVNPVIELPEPPPAPFPGIRTVIATLIPDVVEPYLPPY